MKKYEIWKNGKNVSSNLPGLYAGIVTQGVFGRLDCRSGMRALKKNRIFFHFWRDAVKFGMRPCKLCKPKRRLAEEKEIRQKLKTGRRR